MILPYDANLGRMEFSERTGIGPTETSVILDKINAPRHQKFPQRLLQGTRVPDVDQSLLTNLDL
jgi:hypothetical protein